MLDQITPLILTLDEEANIERVLGRLSWAREVVVVDSGSRDATRALLARFANVRCVEHAFESHAAQWNFGLAQTGIETEWVLALDADYVLSEALIEELRAAAPDPDVAGLRARFCYCVFGRMLRGTLYPPAVVLFRRGSAHYVQDGHTQRVQVRGRVDALQSAILHDDRKPLARWVASQARYAQLEAELLCEKSWRDLGWPDRLRKLLVVMPPLAFVYCLTVNRGVLDGWPGLYYALQRGVAEALLSLALIERMFNGAPPK
jgi:glycosyltransferase involved in cell wall biosynthesis